MNPINSNIQIGKKNAAFFAANPTLILLDGQLIYNEDTGDLFIGDGTTQLSALIAINGGSGGGVWGSITGTLSSQTDLQTALNNKLDASEKSTSANQVVITNGSNVLTSLSLAANESIRRNSGNTAFEGFTALPSSEKSTSANQVVITDNSNVLTSLSLGANQSIRRNAGNTAFEAYTALTSSDIGVTVQAYNANTTLLGNSTTGSGSIVLATSPTISTSLTLSFLTANRIPFAGVGGALSDSSQLIWDASTTRLGVGVSPSNTFAKMEVLADTTRVIGAWLRAAPTGASFPFYCTADFQGRGFVIGSSSLTPTSSATFGMQVNVAAHGVSISGVTNITTGTENVISLQPGSGVVVLGGTTNAGFKLDVIGTARISGALRIGNTVHNVSPTSPNRTIEINVGGTIYYIHAKTTND